jgi:hypothetical protein
MGELATHQAEDGSRTMNSNEMSKEDTREKKGSKE